MAWEISMTNEGWENVYENLHDPKVMETEDLVVALAADDCDDYDHKDLADLERYENERQAFYRRLTHDVIADSAYRRIERHNTCDNGGHRVWIDREGYHTVSVERGQS